MDKEVGKEVDKDIYSNRSNNRISMGFKQLSSIALGASNSVLASLLHEYFAFAVMEINPGGLFFLNT